MSSELAQISSNSAAVIVAAIVVLVVAAGLVVFLLVRLNSNRRDRETLLRERLVEMEREAQFAAAVDRIPHSQRPGDVASLISQLLSEYVSIPVLAVYSGREMDSSLSNVLTGGELEAGAVSSLLPTSAPSSLLDQHARPFVDTLAVLAKRPVAISAVHEETAAAQSAPVSESGEEDEQGAQVQREAFTQTSVDETVGEVLFLPWRGPFGWNGLIVASPPEGITAEALDPYQGALSRLTDKLAVALEFQHNNDERKASEQRASRITSFSRSLVSCLEEASPLDAIVRKVTELAGSDSAALWRVDERTSMVRMVAAHGLKSPEFLPLPLGQGLAGSVAQSGETISVEDAPADPRCIFPREARESGIRSYLGAPLTADGKTLGVIEVHTASGRSWAEADRRSLESAAAIISELIKTSDSRGNRLRVESAYLGLSEALQRLRAPDEVKEAVVEVLGHALGASRVIVVEFDEQGKPEPVKQEYRQPSAKSALGATFGEGLVMRAQASLGGQPIAIADSREETMMGPELVAELDVFSEMAVPIRANGKARAVVYVHQCDRVREWEPDEIEFSERVARQLSLSLANLRSLEVAYADAEQAGAEARRLSEENASSRIQELEQKLESLERVLLQSRDGEEQARAMLAKASALEAKARAEADVSRHAEGEIRKQLEDFQEEHKQVQGSAQQLIEINRLKSEFIVNAGHEIEASLQSVLGLAELLERGSYGTLTPEQHEAVRGIYGWARRIKNDVDWLIEYGSTRSRRLGSSTSS